MVLRAENSYLESELRESYVLPWHMLHYTFFRNVLWIRILFCVCLYRENLLQNHFTYTRFAAKYNPYFLVIKCLFINDKMP